MSSVARAFAQLFSFFFNPLFMPLFGMVWILYFAPAPQTQLMHPMLKRYLLSVTAMFSSLLPLFTLVLMKFFGLTDKLELPRRRDRLMPIAVSCVYALLGFYFVQRLPGIINPLFYLLPLGSAFVLFTALACTARFQVSIHLMGVGALCATFVLAGQFLGVDALIPLLAGIVMAGLTGFARITLNAHKPYQVYAGYLIGFAAQYVSVLLMSMYLF